MFDVGDMVVCILPFAKGKKYIPTAFPLVGCHYTVKAVACHPRKKWPAVKLVECDPLVWWHAIHFRKVKPIEEPKRIIREVEHPKELEPA